MNDFKCFLCRSEVNEFSDLKRDIGEGFVLTKHGNIDDPCDYGDDLYLCKYCRDTLNKTIQSCME